MKRTLLLFIGTILLWACSSNEEYDNVPEPILTFITQYWPNPVIEVYSHPNDNRYEVGIKNGPTLDFNGNYEWIQIDGDGMELPQILLYDELPSPLYEYLESGEYLNEVMEMERSSTRYYLDLLNSYITYDISTSQIRQEFN